MPKIPVHSKAGRHFPAIRGVARGTAGSSVASRAAGTTKPRTGAAVSFGDQGTDHKAGREEGDPMTPDDYLPIAQAARLRGCSHTLIRRRVADGTVASRVVSC